MANEDGGSWKQPEKWKPITEEYWIANRMSKTDEVKDTVEEIIRNVRENGDKALREYTLKFDKQDIKDFAVSREEIEAAYDKVDQKTVDELENAAFNIERFHKLQVPPDYWQTEVEPGITLGIKSTPLERVGCYIPGGLASYPSTALMTVVAAKTAGVDEVVCCTPAPVKPAVLVALDIAGCDEIYTVGGAQAIAAFSYGTESIAPVDVIVGPGNQYVAEAKRPCYGQVGIDFVAGPSEVLAVADDAADPRVLAADLLAQCEHDPNAKAILLATDETLARTTIEEVEKELSWLPTAATARASWDDYGEVVVLDSLEEAIRTANDYAPEHLELNLRDPEAVIEKLYNYGSLFIGGNTAEVFGDYASGTNHTLPTIKAARYTGGVYVGTFLKVCTHQSMTPEASRKIAPLVNRMAHGEGLEGHAEAAKRRF